MLRCLFLGRDQERRSDFACQNQTSILTPGRDQQDVAGSTPAKFVSGFSSRKLCLIADDSVTIRNAARSILRDLKFHTAEAEDGLEALLKCRQCPPDAILLGRMPKMDGFEFLKALRERNIARAPKIIFCTADRDPSQIVRAIGAGAHEYIIRPFDRSILAAKLEELGLTG